MVESRRIPRQVDVHNHGRLLQVQTFAQEVGRQQKVNALGVAGTRRVRRRELCKQLTSGNTPAGDAYTARRECGHASVAGEHAIERVDRLAVLTKRNHTFSGMPRANLSEVANAVGVRIRRVSQSGEQRRHRGAVPIERGEQFVRVRLGADRGRDDELREGELHGVVGVRPSRQLAARRSSAALERRLQRQGTRQPALERRGERRAARRPLMHERVREQSGGGPLIDGGDRRRKSEELIQTIIRHVECQSVGPVELRQSRLTVGARRPNDYASQLVARPAPGSPSEKERELCGEIVATILDRRGGEQEHVRVPTQLGGRAISSCARRSQAVRFVDDDDVRGVSRHASAAQ